MTPSRNQLRRSIGPRGFTLVEVLIAVVITAAIAGAAAITVVRALRAQEIARARGEAFARAALIADAFADDAQNLVRSGDLYDARVLIVDAALPSGDARDEVLLFTTQSRPVRAESEQNEGEAYEVQYRLESPPGIDTAGYVLWRRADPVPDDVPDGGGVASPIALDVASFSVQAFDGSAWVDAWDSDRDGYPHALRVTAVTRDPRGTREAAARRTIAIDRPPTPYAVAQTGSAAAPAATSGSSSDAPATGASGGSRGGGGGSTPRGPGTTPDAPRGPGSNPGTGNPGTGNPGTGNPGTGDAGGRGSGAGPGAGNGGAPPRGGPR